MNRYIRQQQLPGIGIEGQRLLGASRIAVIGCGALGSVVSMYLAGAGVGNLVIADFDTIDISNLQRQLFYTEADAGKSKVLTLATAIRALNSEITVEVHEGLIRKKDMESFTASADVVIEASDNPDTKYIVSDACRELKKPCIIGGVNGWKGQVMTCIPGFPYYRDLFPESASTQGYTPCALTGVAGPVAGNVATLQAIEAIKLITKAGNSLAGRLLLLDALEMTFETIKLI